MEQRKRIFHVGAAAIALAIVLRLFSAGFFSPLERILENPQALSFLLYLQTGRVVRYLPPTEPSAPPPTEMQETQATEAVAVIPTEPHARPVFTADDLASVSITYGCDYRPDLEALITGEAKVCLSGDAPTVLIVHTHATESYKKQPGDTYVEDSDYRTLDENYNMVSIGEEIARILTQGGISVLHDRTFHDYPSYSGSYANARASIKEYLQKYPSIQMVLDIHRDAFESADGQQLTTWAQAQGEDSAQLMLVTGTDSTGTNYPHWESNLAMALQLTALLEQSNPGICRPISLRAQRFNLDLTPASLLVEVGAAGDTHHRALVAARALAESLLALQ